MGRSGYRAMSWAQIAEVSSAPIQAVMKRDARRFMRTFCEARAKKSKGRVAAYGRAMHAATVRQCIVFADGTMLCRDVVPDQQVAGAPLVAVGELRARNLSIKLIQQRARFLLGCANDVLGVELAYEYSAPPGVRVRAHDRVHYIGCFRFLFRRQRQQVCAALDALLVRLGEAEDRLQPVDSPP